MNREDQNTFDDFCGVQHWFPIMRILYAVWAGLPVVFSIILALLIQF